MDKYKGTQGVTDLGLLPNAERATVSEANIVGYLLSPAHPQGRTKDAFFRRFGFIPEQWETLADALSDLALTNPVTERVQSSHGVSYVVEGALLAPDGRQPWVRTVWIVDAGDLTGVPRFVTAYSAEKRQPGETP